MRLKALLLFIWVFGLFAKRVLFRSCHHNLRPPSFSKRPRISSFLYISNFPVDLCFTIISVRAPGPHSPTPATKEKFSLTLSALCRPILSVLFLYFDNYGSFEFIEITQSGFIAFPAAAELFSVGCLTSALHRTSPFCVFGFFRRAAQTIVS